MLPIKSVRTRKVVKAWRENEAVIFDMPLDTVLTKAQIRLFGSVQYAYSAGTPTARPEGAMESLVNRIEVLINGSRTEKSVTPHYLHTLGMMVSGQPSERMASAAAAPAVDLYPTSEGPFVFGTTNQHTTVRETVTLPFEFIYAENDKGREETLLNLRRANSATLTLFCGSLANLNGASGVTGLTFSNVNLMIEVTYFERQDIPAETRFRSFKQTFKRLPISGQLSDQGYDIPSGNRLAGLHMYTQNGVNETASTVKLPPTNLLLGDLTLRKNGQETIQKIDFKSLQAHNRQEYGLNIPTLAGASRFDGIAHLNLISRKNINTAFVNEKAAGVDNLQLVIDSKAAVAGGAQYAQPAIVTVHFEELVDSTF